MAKFIFLFTLLLGISFVSCGDKEVIDENNPGGNIPTEQTPHFSWGRTIPLEEPNGWSLLIQANSVSISNLAEKKQYVLRWEGDLSVGKKSAAVLRMVEKGKQTETVSLRQLEITVVKEGGCFITFGDEEGEGELLFNR